MTVNTVVTPSMTSSNSMSSGYCSLDDESEDFTFFTAKTSFFRKPKQAPKVQKPDGSRPPWSATWSEKAQMRRAFHADRKRSRCTQTGPYSRSVKRKWCVNEPVGAGNRN